MGKSLDQLRDEDGSEDPSVGERIVEILGSAATGFIEGTRYLYLTLTLQRPRGYFGEPIRNQGGATRLK